VFENLSDRLQSVMRKLKGRGRLSEADVDVAMREVRLALLEADVNFKVVKQFVAKVRERAVGVEVMESLTPGQAVIRIVDEELTALMGGTGSRLVLSGRIPSVVMIVGLQGSGKTTAAAKLANLLRKQGRSPMMIACDVYRPAAIDQLESLGNELSVPVYRAPEGTDPVDVARQGIKSAIASTRDVAIIDTAGRLHVDEQMMQEAADIKAATRPDQVLFVLDAMTGQDAVKVAEAFAERVDFDGVVMTKLDGDARGGAALSVRSVTGKPIKFIGVGEKLDALEEFHPDRMAKRILGMGDVLSLIEKAEISFDAAQAEDLEKRMRKAELTLDDFLAQLRQLKKMGSFEEVLAMVPGIDRRAIKDVDLDEGALVRAEAIIQSMTQKERAKPAIINGSRRLRIAKGAAVQVSEVNRLLKQFAQMKKMLKQFTSGKKKGRGFPSMPGGMRFPSS